MGCNPKVEVIMLFQIRSRRDAYVALASLTFLLLGASVAGCLVNEDNLDAQAVAIEPAEAIDTPIAEPAVQPAVAIAEPVVVEEIKEVTYSEAEGAFREKRYNKAVGLFMRYTERKAENPWGFYMLGLSSSRAGNFGEAESAFVRALELDPSHVKSMTNLSRVLLNMERPEEALVRIEEALAIDPGSGDAYRLRGRALSQMGQSEEAADAYREAIRINDRDAWAMNNLALTLMEQGLYDQALETLARATEIRKDVTVFFNNLGMALEKTGHYRDAEDAYIAAVSIDSSHEKAATNLKRVEAVVEDPYLEPVDLELRALQFVDEIESWCDEDIARELPVATFSVPAVSSADVIDSAVVQVNLPDSTVVMNDR
jgi:Flp pilus assembly protein TadD